MPVARMIPTSDAPAIASVRFFDGPKIMALNANTGIAEVARMVKGSER